MGRLLSGYDIGAFKGTNPTKVTLPFVGRGTNTSYNSYERVFGYIFGYWTSQGTDMTLQVGDGKANSIYTSYYYYIPKTVKEVVITDDTRIPYHAFINCSWIEKITISGNISSIGESAFEKCSSITEFQIPETVTSVGQSVFSYCSSLKKVTIPDGVDTINTMMFNYCTSLEEVNFPGNLVSIKNSAFDECISLKIADLVIPNGVNEIGSYAFRDCKKITSITVPSSVTIIDIG